MKWCRFGGAAEAFGKALPPRAHAKNRARVEKMKYGV